VLLWGGTGPVAAALLGAGGALAGLMWVYARWCERENHAGIGAWGED
jgi:hypothetical protein